MSKPSVFNQPKAFYPIFFLELWERFGYYGLQVMLAAFFVKSLQMSDAESFAVFGAFSAMVYGFIAIGGYIGDKVLGTKRTILLGAVTLTLGYFLMGLAGADRSMVFLALSCVAVGNGLFKANPASLLSKLYAEGDLRLDGAFTLYYMAINVGSFFSMVLVPNIGAKFGTSVGFYVCAAGMVVSIFSFIISRHLLKEVDSPPGLKPLSWGKLAGVVLGAVLLTVLGSWMLSHVTAAEILLLVVIIAVFAKFFKEICQSQGAERSKMIVAVVLMVQAVVFFTLYQQMPTSLNFFAIKNVEHSILGVSIANPEVFQSLNPFWIMLLSPVLAYLYAHYGSQGRDLSLPAKFAVGMALCSASFLLLPLGAVFAGADSLVSAWWLVGSYFFQSIGELLIGGLGLAMVARLVPQRIVGFTMGAWFLTTSISGVTGSFVASLTAVPKDVTEPALTLAVYSEVFLKIGVATAIVAFVMFLTVPILRRMINSRDEGEKPKSVE